jgi:hypothetical protein
MTKQWQSNVVFHGYYQQLKVSIKSFLHMTLHTLHQYQPIAKVPHDPHFIYITTKKMSTRKNYSHTTSWTDEDMEQITKEWPEEFLVHVTNVELSN